MLECKITSPDLSVKLIVYELVIRLTYYRLGIIAGRSSQWLGSPHQGFTVNDWIPGPRGGGNSLILQPDVGDLMDVKRKKVTEREVDPIRGTQELWRLEIRCEATGMFRDGITRAVCRKWSQVECQIWFLDALARFSVMCRLITLATFFRQHPLTRCRVYRDARHTNLQRITLCPGGGAVAALGDGCPHHALMKLIIVLTTLFGDHPHPIAGIVRDLRQARLEGIRRPNRGCLSRSRRLGWAC